MATTDSQNASYNCASANGHAEGGVDGPDVFTCRTSSYVVIGVKWARDNGEPSFVRHATGAGDPAAQCAGFARDPGCLGHTSRAKPITAKAHTEPYRQGPTPTDQTPESQSAETARHSHRCRAAAAGETRPPRPRFSVCVCPWRRRRKGQRKGTALRRTDHQEGVKNT